MLHMIYSRILKHSLLLLCLGIFFNSTLVLSAETETESQCAIFLNKIQNFGSRIATQLRDIRSDYVTIKNCVSYLQDLDMSPRDIKYVLRLLGATYLTTDLKRELVRELPICPITVLNVFISNLRNRGDPIKKLKYIKEFLDNRSKRYHSEKPELVEVVEQSIETQGREAVIQEDDRSEGPEEVQKARNDGAQASTLSFERSQLQQDDRKHTTELPRPKRKTAKTEKITKELRQVFFEIEAHMSKSGNAKHLRDKLRSLKQDFEFLTEEVSTDDRNIELYRAILDEATQLKSNVLELTPAEEIPVVPENGKETKIILNFSFSERSSLAQKLRKKIDQIQMLERKVASLVEKIRSGHLNPGLGTEYLTAHPGYLKFRDGSDIRILARRTGRYTYDILAVFYGHKLGPKQEEKMLQELIAQYEEYTSE